MKNFWKVLVLVALCMPKNTGAMDFSEPKNSPGNNHLGKRKCPGRYDEDYRNAFFKSIDRAVEIIDMLLPDSFFTDKENFKTQILSIKDELLKTKKSTEYRESMESIRRAIGNKAAQQNNSEDTLESHDANIEQGDLDTGMFQLLSFIIPESISVDMNDNAINKPSTLAKNILKALEAVKKIANDKDEMVRMNGCIEFQSTVEPLIKSKLAMQSHRTKNLFQLSDIISALDSPEEGQGRQKVGELNKADRGKESKNFDRTYGNDIGKIEQMCRKKKRDIKNNEKQIVKMEETSSKKFEEQNIEEKPRKVLGVIPIPAKLIAAKSLYPKIISVSPLDLSVEYASNPEDRGGQISSPKSAEHKQD